MKKVLDKKLGTRFLGLVDETADEQAAETLGRVEKIFMRLINSAQFRHRK